MTVLNKTRNYGGINEIISKIIEHFNPAWANSNRMLLNAHKTVDMNILLGYQNKYDDVIFFDDSVSILPSHDKRFLGVVNDDHMIFNANVDFIISKCNLRPFYYAN